MSTSSFVRFAVVGLANTIVGYAAILILQFAVGASPLVANAGGYALGMMLSYSLNKTFTFRSRRSHGQALPRFGAAVAGCYVLNLLTLQFGLSVLGLPAAVAQAFAVASYAAAFYVVSRFLVFRE